MKTGLTERELRRYAKQATDVARAFAILADELEKDDLVSIGLAFYMASNRGGTLLEELKEVLLELVPEHIKRQQEGDTT